MLRLQGRGRRGRRRHRPGVGVGLRKGETELKEKINAAIKAIRENGTYDAFSKKYFDFDIYGG